MWVMTRIQVMGYSSEALSGINYDLTNAAGVFTNQPVLVVDQYFDTNLWKFTTNFFQAFDVPLTNGGNKVTLHATDLAGNMTTLTTNFTLDYSSKTNPPVVQLHWPQDGNLIGGDMVTLRGQLDDPTAIITTRLVDTNGVTNIVSGLVERDGKFWMEDVPLNPGTNVVTLTATDAAGNVSVTNINLVQSSVTITIAPVSDDQLNRAITMVAGTIIDPSYSVSVNGVEATVDGSGNWSANDVPINNGGTACFDVTASRSTLSSVKQSAVTDKPSIVEIAHYEQQASITAVSPYSLLFQTNVTYIHWDYDLGGTNQTQLYVPPERGGPYSYVKTAIWPTNGQTGTFEYDVVFPDHTNFWSSGGEVLPGIMENCPTRITAYSDVTYTRTAQAKVRLKTGGKATSTRMNLFTISGSAQRVTNPYYPDLAADSPQPVTIIPAALSLLGKQLGADGYLHIVLPDNSTLDLTPRVNTQSYYTFNVSAIKHLLQIRANGYPLAEDRIRPGAKYCVGQKLNFDAVFVPPVPGLNSASPTWIFIGDYINHHYSDGNGCERYVIAPYWVTQNPTHVWYYNGGKALSATVGMYCAFDNSQTAYPFSRGKFSMYEPSIAFTPVGQAAVHVRRSGLAPVLGIGKSDESDSMTFSVNINSIPQFEGQAIITQLIQRQASIDEIPIPHSLGGGTGGRFDLDNNEIYKQTSLTNKPANPDSNLLGTLNFFDVPGIGIQLASWASCSDHFKTYIRFKPSGDDNIFVTLGRVTWNWSANVLYTGIDPTDLNSWTIQSPTVGGPDFTTTDEFPVWTDTLDNFCF